VRTLKTIDGILTRVETWLIVVFLGVMVVLAFAQVLLRNAFGTSFLWGDTLVRHLVIWSGFMGAAVATSEEKHISIDAITKFLSPRTRHIAMVLTNIFAGVVCTYLASAGWRFLLDEKAAGSELMLGMRTWVGLLVIPAGYLLIALHSIVRSVVHAAYAFGHEPEGKI
jgi:TRAP-type C4-dicarboxylate transport system permease small subunit